jgi:outer membrane protein OmpA-like peptidoglycan-associated protein
MATSDATVSVASNIQSSLNVTPAEIRYHKVGDKVDEQGSTTISWSAPDGTTVSIDPFGSVSTTGSRTDQPTPNLTGYGPIDQTVTYTLHVTNACGVSDTKTASLHIVGSWEGVQHVGLGNSVYFPTAVPTRANPEGGLVASQAQVLEQLVTNLKQLLQVSPNAQLTLEGHADIRGGTQFNIALSERRAERVRAFLVQQGISAANLKTSGLGKGQDPDRAKVLQLAAEAGVSAPEQKKISRSHRIYVLANNRRVDIVLSTGERSHEYYPYTAADLRELLNGHHRGRAAHASKKAKETK